MPYDHARELGGFFKPASIAVIGVSREALSIGGASFLKRHLDAGYPGRLYPVNPKATEILGLKSYPSLSTLPEAPALVMIAVKADLVPAALEECGRKGVRYVHILTSGFSEAGTSEGRELEKRLAAVAAEYRLLVMGPNCMGPYCPSGRFTAWGAIPGRDGHVGVISQSGGITQRFTEYASSLGMGISKAASIGNAAVLDHTDFLEFMAGDDDTSLIACYLESIGDGRRFFDVAREVSPHKPIIMLKGGESGKGAATVESHTGRMAGNRHVWNAFFAQTGLVAVSSMNEWIDACLVFSCLPGTDDGKGVFIVGGGGGNSVIASDACMRAGLDVPGLSRQSMAKLRRFVPAAGSIAGNPLDDWELFLNTERLLEVLDIAYEDDAVSMVIVDRLIPRIAFHGPEFPDAVSEIAGFIKAHNHRKPTVFTIDYEGGDPDLVLKGAMLRRKFCEHGIPAFPSFERAAGALSRFRKYLSRSISLEKL